MVRFLSGGFVAILLNSALAAPVPKEVQESPVCYPTHVGDRKVYQHGEMESTEVVTKVEKTDSGFIVTTLSESMSKTPHKATEYPATVIASSSGLQRILNEKQAPWTLKLPHATDNQWDDKPLNCSLRTLGWEEVTVPAGRFKAVKVERIKDGKVILKTWYAPGVGTVRSESSGGETVLKSFTPGKP